MAMTSIRSNKNAATTIAMTSTIFSETHCIIFVPLGWSVGVAAGAGVVMGVELVPGAGVAPVTLAGVAGWPSVYVSLLIPCPRGVVTCTVSE
jgi:hypothetical protein